MAAVALRTLRPRASTRARATHEAEARTERRDKVLAAAADLPRNVALLPGSEPARAEIMEDVRALEAQYEPDADRDALLGRWALRFASNGTVVTRPLAAAGATVAQEPGMPPGVSLEEIAQTVSDDGALRVTNEATLRVAGLQLQVAAEGPWAASSEIYFDAAQFTILEAFGTDTTAWPQVPRLPIPFGNLVTAAWTTTYLDDVCRVQRAESGNVFVFERAE